MTPSPRRIAFVSPLGGTGQTTVVANLASLWSASGHTCLAVDLCAQNSLGQHLGLQPNPSASATGWAPRAVACQWWAEDALENSAQVRFLPFGRLQEAGQIAMLQHTLANDPQWLHHQLQALALEDPSLVLLDAPAWPHSLALQALACADLVVVCLDASPRAPQVLSQIPVLMAQAAPGTGLAVLATRFNPRRASQCQALEALQQLMPEQLAPYVVHDDEAAPAALAASHCVSSFAPASQSAHDLNGLARWLLARCHAAQEQAP